MPGKPFQKVFGRIKKILNPGREGRSPNYADATSKIHSFIHSFIRHLFIEQLLTAKALGI